ncbi:MAG: CAP domain-containing protein [Terriglobales bacterium]
MPRNTIALLGILLFSGVPWAQNPSQKPARISDASLHQSSSGPNSFAFGSDAERKLFDLANQARIEAGLSPLQADEGLTRAARAHAAAMAAQQQLSHQLPGEPALPQRLAAETKLHLDTAGENVAYAATVERAADNLMHSPQHRENLLSVDYNVAGFAVVQSGPRLYVVQDFGHSLPSFSVRQADSAITDGINHMRADAALPNLQRADDAAAKSLACAMANADSLKTPSPGGRYILRYTAMQPENLPAGISKIIADRALNSFSEGSCYAKTASYPNGAYWVALIFY